MLKQWHLSLFTSIIPCPGEGLPDFSDLNLGPFWQQFEENAPVHLKLGLTTSTVCVAVLLPLFTGYFRTLRGLSPEQRQAVVQRANTLPLFSDLLEIAKIIACEAYFNDDTVQRLVRSRS